MLSGRDAAAFMASASIRYGRELGVIMLVFITAWAYAVVSPLVVVVSAIYFMSSWIVWRWQIVYVYVRCYEGGGSLWRSIIACFMSCLYIFVFFTSCVFVAKQAFYQAAFVFVPLFFIITIFWCAPNLPQAPRSRHGGRFRSRRLVYRHHLSCQQPPGPSRVSRDLTILYMGLFGSRSCSLWLHLAHSVYHQALCHLHMSA